MKRYGNLFGKTFTRETMYFAYLSARKHKRKTKSCLEFSASLGAEIDQLLLEINSGLYQPSAYRQLQVTHPKPRVIHAPCFRDVVVQHTIHATIYSVFDRTFIDTSMACRPGKGTHAASNYAYRAMQSVDPDGYTLHLDVEKFFASIDHGILLSLLRDKIKDNRMLEEMKKFFGPFRRGLVLGNLLSQLYALIYLNPIDHYVKRELKVKRYVRYVDDMIFVGLEKQEALDVRGKVERYLADHLKLGLSKWAMRKVRDGINFVGYRTWPSHRLIRKFSLQKFRRAVQRNNEEAAWSIIAHAQRTSSVAAMRRIISCRPAMVERLPAAHKMRLGIC